MHSDVELYQVVSRMNLKKDIRSTDLTVFEHRHYCNNKRAKDINDTRLENKYEKDSNTFKQRNGLPIDKLLEVPTNIYEKLSCIEILNPPKPTLSILICTLPTRKHFLDKLLNVLTPQLNDRVELLIESDNGSLKIGKKRNILLDKAANDYICFVDDDDLISDTYVNDILEAIENNPDCCSLNGIYTVDGKNPTAFRHSLEYSAWNTIVENGNQVYVRPPNHLNVIKKTIAVKIRFNDSMSNGEDKDYSDRIKPHLKTQAIINNVLYYYLYLNVAKGY